MNKFLDLHGKSIDEATAKVLNTFFWIWSKFIWNWITYYGWER